MGEVTVGEGRAGVQVDDGETAIVRCERKDGPRRGVEVRDGLEAQADAQRDTQGGGEGL